MATAKTETTSNEFAAFIDDFLWQEILARLPVKSIFRFKCVSKSWFSLISHPYFVNKHLQYFHSNGDEDDHYATTLLFVDTAATVVFPKCLDYPSPSFYPKGFSFDFIPVHHLKKKRRFEFAAVSNGWVLCRTLIHPRVPPRPIRYEVYYHVCNPLTQQWLDIPLSPRIQTNGKEFFPMVGFTFEDEENFKPAQFMVTEFLFTIEINRTRLHVHTFSSQTWQWIPDLIPQPDLLHLTTYKNVVSVNPVCNDHNISRVVLIIPLPDGGDSNRCHLGVCHGHIHFTRLKDHDDGSVLISVWKMIKYTETRKRPHFWSLLRSMKMEMTTVVAEIAGDVVEVLGFSPMDADIVYLRWGKYICLVNLKSNTLKKVGDLNGEEMKFMSFVPFVLPYWKLLMKNSKTDFTA